MLQKLLCAGVFIFAAAQSDATAYAPSYTVLKSVAQYDVNADGSYTEDVAEDLRVNTEGGVADLSQYSIQYSTSLQSVKVLDAYTQAPDGKRQPVPTENMLLQQSSESADAPLFDDSKVLNVVFPALAPGVTVHVHFQRVQRIAIFPGVFALQENYSRNEDRVSTDLIIRAPASMPLQIESLQVPGGEVASDKPGYRAWHWRLGRNVAEAPEDGAISEIDYSPRVAVSTLGGYDDLAHAYQDRARAKAAVTPAIQQLADQITAGATDPRQEAELLYRWVSKNIRYVAIYFGVGGVVPHSADEIAHAMYGDCKDHVTLYQALLAAKGIKSSPVLVNADQSWWLSRVAVPTGAFDHAITYLPQWNLFVDTTAQFAQFGVLPDTEAGKTALVTDDGAGHSRLMSLPLSTPGNDRVEINSDMTLSADGSIKGISSVAQQGIYDYLARSTFSAVSPGMEADAVSKLLQARGMQGSGTLSLSNVYDLTKPFAYRSAFDLPDYVDLSGPTGVVLPSGQDSIDGLQAFVSWAGVQTTRRYPMMLDNGYYEETLTLKLPAGIQVLALPRAVDINSPLGHYQASYQKSGGAITVHRVLVLQDNAPVLAPERYPLLHQLARSVARDLRAQILLQPS